MFREDLFQEILNHTIPNIHAVECKFVLFSLFFYVLKTNLCLETVLEGDKHIP